MSLVKVRTSRKEKGVCKRGVWAASRWLPAWARPWSGRPQRGRGGSCRRAVVELWEKWGSLQPEPWSAAEGRVQAAGLLSGRPDQQALGQRWKICILESGKNIAFEVRKHFDLEPNYLTLLGLVFTSFSFSLQNKDTSPCSPGGTGSRADLVCMCALSAVLCMCGQGSAFIISGLKK